MHAIAYIRCSTSRQDLSPGAQRDAIRQWASSSDAKIVEWFEDLGVSGGAALQKRPGLISAVEALRPAGATVLVVAKRDRLARSVLVSAMVERLCERAGATIQSADGTGNGTGPEAQLLRGIMDVFAAYERAIIRSRTKAALAVKKARGERVGGIPYGKRLAPDGVALEAHPEEQAAVVMARELRREGRSLRAIGSALLEAGHNPRKAKRWHVAVIGRLVAGCR